MNEEKVIEALSALAHGGRLDMFRYAVAKGTEGVTAGDIAAKVGQSESLASTNLGVLTRAGLLERVREGRFIRYRANFMVVRDVLGYLLQDCCGGRPELCDPFLSALSGNAEFCK